MNEFILTFPDGVYWVQSLRQQSHPLKVVIKGGEIVSYGTELFNTPPSRMQDCFPPTIKVRYINKPL